MNIILCYAMNFIFPQETSRDIYVRRDLEINTSLLLLRLQT